VLTCDGGAARRTIVVIDSSKFGRRILSLIMPTSAVHEAITDPRLQIPVEALRDADVEVTWFRALRAVQVEAECTEVCRRGYELGCQRHSPLQDSTPR